jgi:hypothetical protein
MDLTAKGIRLAFDPSLGLLDGLVVTDGGREISLLHRAPWVGTDERMPEGSSPHLAKLGGDFFCAPFAQSDNGSPLHGWPPNSAWTVIKRSEHRLRAELDHDVRGARLTKELILWDGHPFVYQRHIFAGGQGRVSVSNHANVSVRHGALIRTSPKLFWETPKTPQESDPMRGRSGLIYPAGSKDPCAFPGVDGPVDLTTYPWNPRHEDFVLGIEAAGHALGWVAVTRPVEGDLFLSLRNPRELPMSMLWHSNGGRDYAPWSGRHIGCLGVEEGAASHMLGSSCEEELTGPGALALEPGGSVAVRHVIGAIAWPSGKPVRDLRVDENRLIIEEDGGAERVVPFDAGFLGLDQVS